MDAPLRDGWLLERLGDEFVLLGIDLPPKVSGVRCLSLRDLGDVEGLVAERYDLREGGCYLFRPDQYVAARWRTFDPEAVERALGRAKGLIS